MVADEKYIAGVKYPYSGETQEIKDAAEFKQKSLTIIFHTFVFLQIFNYINCRKVGRKDFNVFEEFGHNFYFLGIFFGTFAFQYILGS